MVSSSHSAVERDVTARRVNPAEKWVCGYRSLGRECRRGPTCSGKCGLGDTRTDWAPAAEDSDLDLLREFGPCIPKRSSWYARRVVAASLGVLTAAVLLWGMASPMRETVFVPGRLTHSHAQILSNRTLEERCGLCHPAAHPASSQVTQEMLCMECHRAHLPNAQRSSPHDLAWDQWEWVLRDRKPTADNVTVGAIRPVAWKTGRSTRCAECHREHHGKDHRLQTLTDAQCQSCHARQFQSFASGHPEFDGYPYATTRRIRFDHAVHRDKHFPQTGQRFACSDCHVDRQHHGIVGTLFRSTGFERACGRCHAVPMAAQLADGWDVLAIPSLDPSLVGTDEYGIEHWPAEAQFGTEGRIPILLRVLLAADDAVRSDLAELPVSGKLEDLPPAVRNRIGGSIARGLLACLDDLDAEGQKAWERRLANVLQAANGGKLDGRQRQLVRRASSGVPPDLFSIMKQWFAAPELAASNARQHPSEIPTAGGNQRGLFDFGALDAGEQRTTTAPRGGRNGDAKPGAAPGARVAYGGWVLEEATFSLKYRGKGHADPAITAWADYLRELERLCRDGTANGTSTALLTAVVGQPPGARRLELLGICYQCHVADPAEAGGSALPPHPRTGGKTAVRAATLGDPDRSVWKAVRRPDTARLFTRFDHTPHIALPALSDCTSCHRLRESSAERGGASMAAPTVPEFDPMQRDQCIACHGSGEASRCTTCHLYHVGDSGLKWGHQGGSVKSTGVTSSGEGSGSESDDAGTR